MGINPWFCGFRDCHCHQHHNAIIIRTEKNNNIFFVVGPWELEPFRHSDLLLFFQYSLRFFICPLCLSSIYLVFQSLWTPNLSPCFTFPFLCFLELVFWQTNFY